MATDFFDRQDHARRQTTRLVVLFALSVAAIILTIYFALVAALNAAEPYRSATHVRYEPDHFGNVAPVAETPRPQRSVALWQPEVLLWVTLGTLAVVGLGSLYKISELSSGGETIALMLGGRAVDPQTRDLAERRLLNVVEEMALASGVPVPPVYVLDNEPSINAFAAGHQPGDAVVAVSAGALKCLNREELQGVMGHEFSHILNGDMRLNLRLIGVVYGILVLAVLGYYLMRSAGSFSSGSRREGGGAAAAVLVGGLVMMILGYLGVFFGNLIKAAISRQREYLADASAVQFTRQPGGLAGALKKIGGLAEGSRIRDAHAHEISHMFFGDAFAGSLFNLFATHPPLEDRIRALEPDFDGRFPETQPVAVGYDDAATATSDVAAAMAFTGGTVRRQPEAASSIEAPPRLDRLAEVPLPLMDAVREPLLAQAVVFLLLLSRDDDATLARQWEMLRGQIDAALYRQTQQMAAAVLSLPATARLPLVDVSVPALKRCSPQQYQRFRQVIEALVGADGKVDLFEYCLRTVLFSYLDVHFGLKRAPAVRYRSVDAVRQPLTVVLSSLVYVGQSEADDVQRAFAAASQNLPQVAILPREECSLRAFDAAMAELAQTVPQVKRAVLSAATACVTADGRVTLEEGELLRAVAAALSCPMPLVRE
jgi:Zn-dependent protease with chaperone function